MVITNALVLTESTDSMTNVRSPLFWFYFVLDRTAIWYNWVYCFLVRFIGKRRYSIKLWKTFTDCFNCLPVAAIIDEKIFCCHGGLGPDLQSMEQIRRIMRPTDVPDQGLLCDLLWSDPDKVSIWPKWSTSCECDYFISDFFVGHDRLGWKWSRCIVYFRTRSCG